MICIRLNVVSYTEILLHRITPFNILLNPTNLKLLSLRMYTSTEKNIRFYSLYSQEKIC